MLDEVVRRDPKDADAWLWLAGARAEPNAKRDAFDRVLALRPADPEATAGLERLAQKYGAGVLEDVAVDELEMMHCTWHSSRETLLRCNRCGRPMCPDCARQHPVGLRCKACMKETRSPLYKVDGRGWVGATLFGGLVGVAAAVLLILLASIMSGFLELIVGFLIGGVFGNGVAEAVSRGSGRKKGRGLQWVAAGSLVGGVLLAFFGLWVAGVRVGPPVFGIIGYLVAGLRAATSRLK